MTVAVGWARAEAAPSAEEMAGVRRLIRRHRGGRQAHRRRTCRDPAGCRLFRKTRQGFLGMPRIP